jgi:hypothetical protein
MGVAKQPSEAWKLKPSEAWNSFILFLNFIYILLAAKLLCLLNGLWPLKGPRCGTTV